MMNPQDPDDFDNGLPEELRSALKNRYGPVPEIPAEVDEAVIADARRHLSSHVRTPGRRRWSTWQLTAISSTIIAACVMLFVWMPDSMNESDTAFRITTVKRDLDGNGRVDILDAFAMARQIRSGDSGARDVNGDGRFDHLDVDLVAREAVMLF